MRPTFPITSTRLLWIGMAFMALIAFGPSRGDSAGEARATNLVGWAIVKGNGQLQGHRHVVENHRDGVGQYRIVFDRNVHRCTYNISFRDHADSAFVYPTTGQRASVTITTWANPGAVDGTFDLQVFCG